jgi:hypothetical protein
MKTVELFAGTKSFSKVMQREGHSILTFDNELKLEPDICKDIFSTTSTDLPENIDMLWASPPCTTFSVASIGHHWSGGKEAYVPKTEEAKRGIKIVEKTIETIKESKPKWWFIENPRGVLRKLAVMKGLERKTVTYCQYGDTRMKPTDIWTNAYWWNPRPMCKNGSKCHVSAPRGSRTGTQGIKNAKLRGVIPEALFEEILVQLKNYEL